MTAHELVPRAPEAPAERSRMERWEEPVPGSYWRLQRPFEGAHRDDGQIRGNPVAEGTVLLLSGIEIADGAPHAYVFSPHPLVDRAYRHPLRVHVDVFHEWFAFEPDGEAVRSRELAQLQQAMSETQARMLQPPPAATPIAALGFEAEAGGTQGSALATRESITDMTRYAAAVEANAKAMTAWIEENNQELGQQASAMARFHSERAEASLARAQQQLDGVKGLLKTVANLQLYVGEGVSLTAVRDGQPAPPDARLTIYQDLLALDEETAVHVLEGGLDHTHAHELGEILADDALVDRLIPAPRGVVLVRFRATHKAFFAGDDAGSAMADAAMNEEARRKHLLVRDGQRVWMVRIPDALQGISQLMPSAAEQLDHFTTHDGNRIRREHLGYAQAQRRQLGNLDAYAQSLIILWGLYDRGEIMSGWALPRFSNWLDPGVQTRHMVLCDQSTMLGEEREGYSAFRRRHNQYLGSGATVAVQVGKLFDHDHIPGAFASQACWDGRRHEYSELYGWDREPGRTVHIGRVRSNDRGLYVELPLLKHGSRSQRRTGKLYLSPQDDAFLVLDRVHGPDLMYFLTSREQRRGYAAFLLLFQEARAWVLERDAGEAPLREALAAAAAAAHLDTAADRLEPAITSALAVARTARRDKTVPDPGTPAHRTYLRAALDTLHSLLTDQEERISRAERWAMRAGRELLRLSLAGGQQWRLYLVPLASEHEPLMGEARHVTVASVAWTGEDLEATVLGREMLQARADEQVIRDWNRTEIIRGNPRAAALYERRDQEREAGAKAWQGKESLFPGLSYQEATDLLDTIRAQEVAAPSPAEALAQAIAYMDADKSRSVARMTIGLPVGTLLNVHGRPLVLFAQVDALSYAYCNGDPALREQVLSLVSRRYMHPDGHLRQLKALTGAPWCAGAAPLADARRMLKHGYAKEALVTVDGRNILVPGAAKQPRWADVRLTSLTPRGAELLPWTKELAESALLR